ncbi:hypothetical protein AB6M97_06075 [Streptococcus hillyeri]|uniref:hypothetical protein n=1 Tax=Streptococcus hillyeri TaxID=2282420 RepID=UPI0034E1D771
MRAWNIVGKYPVYDDEGKVSHTDITIASTTGSYATYTERTIGDQRDKSEQELVELAREAHFKSEYAERAMAESVVKIDEMEVNIKEGQKLRQEMQEQLEFTAGKLAQVDDALERSETQFTKVEELIKVATATVNELIAGMMGDVEDEETIE